MRIPPPYHGGVARFPRIIPSRRYRFDAPCARVRGPMISYLDEIVTDDKGSRIVRLFRHRLLREAPGPAGLPRQRESAAPHKERAHG